MRRSSSVGNKLGKTVWNTSGWTHAALIKQTILSSQKLLSPCFTGIVMQTCATCTYQMLRSAQTTTTRLSGVGNLPFVKADGSHGAGHFKNSLLQNQSNSFPEKESCWVIKRHSSSRSTRSQASLLRLSAERHCLTSALMSGCDGRRSGKLKGKKIAHTVYWAFLMSLYLSCMARERTHSAD
jgi:hypothetical protein